MGLDARAGGDGRFLALQKRISEMQQKLAELEAEVSTISSGETGPQGPQGDDYVLTQQDQQDIAQIIIDDGGLTVPTKTSDLQNDVPFLNMGFGTSIPENADLDDYTTPGVYTCHLSATAATLTNSPTTGAFRLEVRTTIDSSNNPCVRQTIYSYNSSNSREFVRTKYSTWGTWKMVYTSNETIPIANGGTGATSALDALQNLFAPSLDEATEIPKNSNLNNYTTPGTYYCASYVNAATITNTPTTGVAYRLFVVRITSGERFWQIALSNASSCTIYVRSYTGSWNAWRRLVPSTY